MMAAAAAGGCVGLWREENDALVRRWRTAVAAAAPDTGVSEGGRAARECRLAFAQLRQAVQGLPPALPVLPLELTILYNALLFDTQQSSHSGEEQPALVADGLRRVLEACGLSEEGLSLEERWHRVLQERLPGELTGSLHRLAGLQGALWLAAKDLRKAEGLFQQLSTGKSPEASVSRGCQKGLLSLLQGWDPPEEGESGPLTAQSARDLKSILWTAAAFSQGIQELEAEDASAALASLQTAAAGLCSKPLLARIFTLMGSCNLKLGRPQMALQHLKRALQVDFACLPALYQAALLYRQLGLLEAELDSLGLLCQALEGPAQAAPESSAPHFLIGTEFFAGTPPQIPLFAQNCPSGVKYLLAQRCLQAGRVSEAAEHYLDLLALLQERPLCQCGEPPVPRVPEVFLEAASALVGLARPEEAVVLCEEVVTRTSELVPKRLRIEPPWQVEQVEEERLGTAGSALAHPQAVLQKQKRESLRCVLWRAAAYLLQGWAWARRGEAKEAIGCMSRCLNDLLKVHFVNTGSVEAEMEPTGMPEGELLCQLRQLALTGRGAQFLELGQDKEALRDFRLSLLVGPESPTANLYFLHMLWKVGRRKEAAEHWQRFRLDPVSQEEHPKRSLPLYLLLYGRQMVFPHLGILTRNIASFLEAL